MSLLNFEKAVLTHNKWTQKVDSEIQKKQLEEVKDIINDLREALNAPRLFLEIATEKPSSDKKKKHPYTNEEKLEAMQQKNPYVRKFIQKFDTMIGY